jgi:hypothetical protein
MGCTRKEGMCEGFKLGWVHCTKNCPHYKESKITTNTNYLRYEQPVW